MLQRLFFIVSITCFCTFGLSACGGALSDTDDDEPSTTDDREQEQEEEQEAEAGGFAIRSRSPEPDARDRALITDIEIRFTEELIAETVSREAIQLNQEGAVVDAQLEFNNGSDRMRIVPEAPLQPETRYSVSVSDDLMATDGTSFSGASWTFTTAANVGATPQSVIDDCMSDADIEMLGRINDARSVSRTCGDHNAPAVASLKWHCTIAQAAQRHSDDMAENNFFSHTGSDGTGAGERLSEAGYAWRTAAENIAAGQPTVEKVMMALLRSPGHYVNIMNGRFTEVGTAVADNPGSTYGRYWTQNFARPQ